MAIKKYKKSVSIRRSYTPFSALEGFSAKTKLLIRKAIPFCQNTIAEYIQWCCSIPYGETKHYSNIAFPGYNMHEYHRTAVLEQCILLPFEDTEFYVMSRFDEALMEKYGDYLQLPPIEEQKPRHVWIYYYWR